MEYLSQKIQDLLKMRIQNEEYSGRLYQAMAQYMDYCGYDGGAKLWYKYSQEEFGHAKLITSYLLDLDYLPPLPSIKEPPLEFDGLCDIIRKSKAHEEQITMECTELAKVAFEEVDLMTFSIAQKLVIEQIEENSKVIYWSDKLELFGESEIALKMLDKEMGEKA